MKWLKEIELWLLPVRNGLPETSYEVAAIDLTFAKVKELEARLETLERQLLDQKDKNERLKKALEFYADTADEFKDRYGDIGGKRARQALKSEG